ncbi:hypothetical protein LZ578_12040 (plasmid) [Jeotgalibaca sp. MA1X17-3]|uniref:hypothetical protein n=1 Tax=Jeotgalibaca sp. MA1X17-3 TaxID=2908211 RepID=UPI001F24AA0B|nr:hypothetical protein [Jeotgalibaca sp. MA1X17-3]UJF16790.1 hypothetical protein LZ578_12040 [Jeotgalibaca sp. MA1X17-3]
MLERFKDGVTVSYEKGESKEKRNEKRHKAIREQLSTSFSLHKDPFLSYLHEHNLDKGNEEAIETIKTIDFSRANPRNNSFINELAFAGQGITEGFLECFSIERDTAVEKYEDQLQVIEKKEEGEQPVFYVGTFLRDKLVRVSDYEPSRGELDQKLNHYQKDQLANQQQQQPLEKERMQQQTRTLTRRREDES